MIETVENLDSFDRECEIGYVVYNEEDGKYYAKSVDGWIEVNNPDDTQSIAMTLYEINKQVISQLSTLTQEQIQEKIEMINNWYDKTCYYYMLYGREISYFTLFVRHQDGFDVNNLGEGVIHCLNNIGEIKSVDITPDNAAIEIWICDSKNNTTCLYLFDYSEGVVFYEK